ncbi:MAG: branched-chain amino acid transport system ATP-binding protein [Marinobacter excellens HL-55]|uniref:Branched-chain amino acid transport system ATP-binding protein n=1 Tax=Marinobacter excellens HL-55 TaxID=1305731 RepID=A0A0P7YFP5_9GAMM|nr:MAG: branched-chain amino acid transport system ATP-binding protein [Marinobacter excellens HL-55]
MLDVQNLSMRFGGLLAVDQVSLDVQEHEIVSVIGPNGAGKTTVFNCLSGFYTPTGGKIVFEGQEVQGKPDYKISRLGMVRTFQHVRLFNQMSVVENLLVAQHRHLNTNLLSGLIKTPNYREREQKSLDRAAYWLDRVGLLDLANRDAGNLAYGQQRRLEIARCMVTEPKLLMLDEPAAGLNPAETKNLNQLIVSLKEDYHVSVLLIEHDMSLVMDISDRITVINQGRPLASGTPSEVRENDDVIKAYLGEA